jgi:phosphoribosylcarboxyaminoimidazole (NCAIR) mutase
VIFVPLLSKNSSVEAIPMLETTKQGLWVGIGRAENAAIAAVEILNAASGKFSKKLLAQRKQTAEKTVKADAAERKKFE